LSLLMSFIWRTESLICIWLKG